MTGSVESTTIGCKKSERVLAQLRCRRCCSAGVSGRLVLEADLGQVELTRDSSTDAYVTDVNFASQLDEWLSLGGQPIRSHNHLRDTS